MKKVLVQIERPCPFCAADGDDLVVEVGEAFGNYVVRCRCCGAIGPSHDKAAGAMLLWDRAAVMARERSECGGGNGGDMGYRK